jgi:DNA processing protein
MPPSDEAYAWATLTRAPGLSVPVVTAALARLGTAQNLLAASAQQRRSAGLPAKLDAYLVRAGASPTKAELRWLEHPRHHIVPYRDCSFPRLLLASGACPIAIYVDGDVLALRGPQLAIVGSRNPSAQGRERAFEFAQDLAGRGLTITSGLAEGIDSEAHRGALAAHGSTLAVLGTGIDLVYPRGNRPLALEIAQRGALISAFPVATPPSRGNFPQRNRLIAALSLGTLVVEAALGSGSLLTARSAGELGREVFAIPGSINNPLTRGCHDLIKHGAKLTETAHDILTELDFSAFLEPSGKGSVGSKEGAPPAAGMDNEQKILLDALGFDPADLDSLVVRTGFKPEAVSSMMLILELEGYVQAAPGGRYSRVARSP